MCLNSLKSFPPSHHYLFKFSLNSTSSMKKSKIAHRRIYLSNHFYFETILTYRKHGNIVNTKGFFRNHLKVSFPVILNTSKYISSKQGQFPKNRNRFSNSEINTDILLPFNLQTPLRFCQFSQKCSL